MCAEHKLDMFVICGPYDTLFLLPLVTVDVWQDSAYAVYTLARLATLCTVAQHS